MESGHGGSASRTAPERPRGARPQPTSVKALVRIAKRVIREQEWGSIEFSSSTDGNSIRVHRAPGLARAATPSTPAQPSGATAASDSQGKSDKKARKKLKFIRHGVLSKLNARLASRAFRGPWGRWCEYVVTQRAAIRAVAEEEAQAADHEAVVSPSAMDVATAPVAPVAAPASAASTRAAARRAPKGNSPAKAKKGRQGGA